MVRTIATWALLLAGFVAVLVAQDTKPADQAVQRFQQDLAQLRQKPEDNNLRKKVIQDAQEMNPVPEIPKEAHAHFSKGYVTQREAKSAKDYQAAVDEYRKAIELAPWWAAVYYHLGSAYERLNQYDEGIANLNLFLASHPGGAGEQEARDRIHNMEQAKKKAAQKKSGR
jgi:tetratricopeptide (TPR) repeat protein